MGEMRLGAGEICKVYLGDKLIYGGEEKKEYIICAIDYHDLNNNYLGIIDDTNNLVAIYNYQYVIDTDHTILLYDKFSNILYGIEDSTKIANISFDKVIYQKDGVKPQNIICLYDKLIIGEHNSDTGRGYIKKIDSINENNEYLIYDDQGANEFTQGFVFKNKIFINNYSAGFFSYDKYTNDQTKYDVWYAEITNPIFVNDDCYVFAPQEDNLIKIDKSLNVSDIAIKYDDDIYLSYTATHLSYINGKFIIYANNEYIISTDSINWKRYNITGNNVPTSNDISIKYRSVNNKVFAYYLQNGNVYTAFSSDGVTFDFEDKTYTLPNSLGTTKMYVPALGEDCMTVVNDNFLKAVI